MATRYDQCDDTCTVDCGHCKGQGVPATSHTKDRLPTNGPPFCVECSAVAQDWVKWPCAAVLDAWEREVSV